MPRLVSEGDSWFDYPMHLNLIDHLDDRGEYAILRFEKAGDTVANMVKPGNLDALQRAVRRERPVAFLFSGGGNDMFIDIRKEPKLRWIYEALNDYQEGFGAEECINKPIWDVKRLEIERGIVAVIDAIGPLAPVITHGYDYLIPTGKKAEYDGFRVGGPWIKSALDARKIPTVADPGRDLHRKVIAIFMNDFNAMLVRLQERYPRALMYVDLRKTLDPARDWHNEIHPTQAGFKLLEERFSGELRRRLPELTKKRAAHGVNV